MIIGRTRKPKTFDNYTSLARVHCGPLRSRPLARIADIDPFEVADQLGSHPASGLPDDVTWADLGEQRLGLGGGEVLLRAARDHSSSSWCSWATIRVWSSPSERRRSTRIRSTASCSSLTTGRSPAIRVPTSATECASVASVLRPCGGEDPGSC